MAEGPLGQGMPPVAPEAGAPGAPAAPPPSLVTAALLPNLEPAGGRTRGHTCVPGTDGNALGPGGTFPEDVLLSANECLLPSLPGCLVTSQLALRCSRAPREACRCHVEGRLGVRELV